MKDFTLKEFLPALILICGLVYTLIIISTTDTALTIKHYGGLLLIVIIILLYIKRSKLFKKALAITLILGTINVLAFTPSIHTLNFGIDQIGISIQLCSLFALLLFVVQNRKRLEKLVGLERASENMVFVSQIDEEKVERYKYNFSDKSLPELNKIVSSNGTYVIEAIEAAKQLIKEKNAL
jgi:hypothetical protein